MGSYNQTPRNHKSYTNDNPNLKVYPKDCVPDNRSHGSWTNGVKAWQKGESGSSDQWIGWFHPPRIRNKGHKSRYGKSRGSRATHLQEEE
tara:strand:+ start:1342 stop:1611 length:270 start_codon:yes stop_codon:yes gene_type:complete